MLWANSTEPYIILSFLLLGASWPYSQEGTKNEHCWAVLYE